MTSSEIRCDGNNLVDRLEFWNLSSLDRLLCLGRYVALPAGSDLSGATYLRHRRIAGREPLSHIAGNLVERGRVVAANEHGS